MILSMILLAGSVAGAVPPAHVSGSAEAFIKNDLKLARYQSLAADLNGDGSPEVIVYAADPQFCGSGGCTLFILTPKDGTYRVLTKVTVTRPPVRVLATSSHGWSDLAVQVAGGGIQRPYEARLRFDGRTYPSNPTVAPAAPAGKASGRVVIE